MTAKVTKVLNALHADAAKNDPRIRRAARKIAKTEGTSAFHKAMRMGYMSVEPDLGNLLYLLTRTSKAKTVVEFGTSFGISTIYLAGAVRDNGDGKVIATEFIPEKAERARKNLVAAGLEQWVEIRVGNALETLKSGFDNQIDLIFLDGAKELYLDVLKLLESNLRRGGIVVSDNTNHDGAKNFLKYVRAPRNGYISSAISSGDRNKNRGHEVTIRN